jgi:hypothetical protein
LINPKVGDIIVSGIKKIVEAPMKLSDELKESSCEQFYSGLLIEEGECLRIGMLLEI